MDASVMIAGIGAVPATIGACAAVIAAKRTGASRRDIRRVLSLLDAHVKDGTIHNLPTRRMGAFRKEGTA